MPNFRNPLQLLTDVLQKPQSIAIGALSEVTGSADDARQFVHKYESALVPDTDANWEKYQQAKSLVGDSEATGGSITNIGSALQGAIRGAKSNIHPSDVAMNDAASGKILDPIENLAIDPLMFTGGAGSKVLEGTRAGELLKSAGTVGKLGEGANKADKAAQLGRRLYQGALIGGGDPFLTIGAATGIGGVEKFLPAIGTRLAKLFTPEMEEQIADSVGALVRYEGPGALPLNTGPIKAEALTGDLVPWEPGKVPPLSQDPATAAARQGLEGQLVTNPRNIGDILGNNPLKFGGAVENSRVLGNLEREYSVGPSRGGLRQREVYGPLDRTQVPQSDEGLQAILQNLGNGIPTQREIPALNAAPNSIPLGPVPTGTAVERVPQLFEDIPRMDVSPTGMFNQGPVGELPPGPGPAIPVGPVENTPNFQPYLSRNPDMQIDPQVLLRMSQGNRLPAALPPGEGFQRPDVSRFDSRLLPERMRALLGNEPNKSQLEEFLLSLIK
jgi:hypothetical protein